MRLLAFFSIHARITLMAETPQTIANPERVDFLQRIHLFYRLEEEHFDSVAEKAHEQVVLPGEVVIRQGEIGDKFFMIFSGSVNVTRRDQRSAEALGKLVTGD
jgi:signal-transduction protein with cAMP-binding, CBS, and nucleotidyltransferase domain